MTRPSSTSQKRKRGGQLGNNNALKHGFYSRLYKEREKKLLSQISHAAVQGEIDLTRVTNRRVLETLNNTPGLTFEQVISGTHAIGLGTARIASLTRIQIHAARITSNAREAEEWLKNLNSDSPPADEIDP